MMDVHSLPGRPAIGLPALLAISFLGRLPAVFCSRGYEFYDEQFQYVDPAFHLATGSPFRLTHEWTMGLRSWVYPGILSVFMRAASALGIEDPRDQMVLVRGALAILSLVAVIGVHGLLVRKLRLENATLPLLIVSLNGISVFQGVHPNGPGFSCVLIVFGVCAFLHGGRLRSALAGLAVGLAFCCRPQDGIYGVPLLAAGLLAKRWRETLLFSAGCACMIVVQGVVDLYTWGSFLHSPIAYVRFNLEGNRNAQWGHEPWFTYAVLLIGLAPLLHEGLRWVWQGARRLPWVAIALAVSLGAHQMITHKSARFVSPALVLFVLLWAVGASSQGRALRGWARASLLAGLTIHVIGWGLASFAYPMKEKIDTAVFLSHQPGNGAVYVGLSIVDTGGVFYYRNPAPLRPVAADGLAGLLASTSPPPSFLVQREHRKLDLPPGWHVEKLRRFCPLITPRKNRCLEVYRLVRD